MVLHWKPMSTVVLKALHVRDAEGKRPGRTLGGRQAPWHVISLPSSVAWGFPSGEESTYNVGYTGDAGSVSEMGG